MAVSGASVTFQMSASLQIQQSDIYSSKILLFVQYVTKKKR